MQLFVNVFFTLFAVNYTFQNGGSYILATDASQDSILSVWQWQWGHLLGKVAVSIRIHTRTRGKSHSDFDCK